MHRSTQRPDPLRERVFAGRQRRMAQRRRAATARKNGRRIVAVLAGLAVVASVITATQLASNALEGQEDGLGAGACRPTPPPTATEEADPAGETAVPETSTPDLEVHQEVDEDGNVHYHHRTPGWGDGDGEQPPAEECEAGDGGDGDGDGGDGGSGGGNPGDGDGGDPGDGDGDPGDGDPGDGDGDPGGGDGGDGGPGTVPPGGEDGDNNGLDILGRDCTGSDLPLHTGFQSEQAQCVNTQAGEVSALEDNPSLLITEFPDWVEVDQPFSLTVSTRNLLRDRFLGAGAGGYYLEASFLTPDGIQRGHFHTACVNLVDGQVAPSPDTLIEPQFFAAVEDSGGGAGVDAVSVEIPGLPEPGLYRCTVWAGDPSHRIPMMSFAREQPPVDAVRITVTEAGGQ